LHLYQDIAERKPKRMFKARDRNNNSNAVNSEKDGESAKRECESQWEKAEIRPSTTASAEGSVPIKLFEPILAPCFDTKVTFKQERRFTFDRIVQENIWSDAPMFRMVGGHHPHSFWQD
jgi:hypothetical protein